jgi:substrate-binding protein of zinc uptake complex component A
MEEEKHGTTHKITDAHAWQSLANGRVYVQNIRDGLIAADPAGRDTYERREVPDGDRHGRNGRQGQYRQAAAGAPPNHHP